jgi:S-adenosylmethionine synthetase
MDVVIEALPTPPLDARPFEIVERKGLGHPDTICDALAEALSVALCRFYRERFGVILHHNVDKALLCGGRARPAFGGGEVLAPVEVYLAGRATLAHKGVEVPVEEIAREACHKWFRGHFRAFDPERHLRVHCRIRPGSAALVELFAREGGAGPALANDTSCGVGFAPLSALENAVLAVERHLNAPATKRAHPAIGEDVKVMGLRRNGRIGLTLACAFIDRHVADVGDYAGKKEAVAALALEAAGAAGEAEIAVNTGDDLEAGDLYLTVTGTSAEAGDDGEVGRGNRANGLITPFRPMTLEASAGKNPVTHVGKLYNVAAGRIAAAAVESVAGVEEVHCLLLSQIGRPVSDPQVAHLGVRTADAAPAEAHRAALGDIVAGELARLDRLWEEALDGGIGVF